MKNIKSQYNYKWKISKVNITINEKYQKSIKKIKITRKANPFYLILLLTL